MAEFAMIIVLLMLLFLALVSVGLWLYTRTVLTAAAADVARYVGNADVAATRAVDKVRELLGDGVAGSTDDRMVCTAQQTGDLVGVSCTVPAPGIISLLDGVLPDIVVTGHSAKEG